MTDKAPKDDPKNAPAAAAPVSSVLGRDRFAWDVQVQTATGEVSTERVAAYWSPDHALTEASVQLAARAQVSARLPRNAPFPAHAGTPVLVTA